MRDSSLLKRGKTTSSKFEWAGNTVSLEALRRVAVERNEEDPILIVSPHSSLYFLCDRKINK